MEIPVGFMENSINILNYSLIFAFCAIVHKMLIGRRHQLPDCSLRKGCYKQLKLAFDPDFVEISWDMSRDTCRSPSIVTEDGAAAKSLASSLVVPPVPSVLPRPSRPHTMLQTARRSWAFPRGFDGRTILSPTFPVLN